MIRFFQIRAILFAIFLPKCLLSKRWNDRKPEAPGPEMFKHPGQYVEHVAGGLDGVMENDDGAGHGVPDHIIEAPFRGQPRIVIVAQQRPHYDAVFG